MADDVLDERGDGLVVAEDAFEACQLVLGLGELFVGGTFVGEVVKLAVEQFEHLLVEFEVEHAALVIDGTRGAILDGLRHVVDVDVVAKNLLRVAVAVGKRGAREADERSVGQGFAHLEAEALLHAEVAVVPMLVAILAAVCLVGHDDDVAAVAEHAVAFLELLDGGEDDAAAHTAFEQLGKFLAALGLLWCLTQEVLAAAELSEELVVEVLAVGDHDERTFGEVLDEEVGKEHHAQRLARALRMPEDANLAIARHGLLGALQGLAYGIILVIGGEDLADVSFVAVEADEVAEDVEQLVLAEHFEEEGSVIDGTVLGVGHLPLHVARLVGGDGAGAGVGEVADDVEGVEGEEVGHHCLVVLDLQEGVVDAGIFGKSALQFDDDDRQAVQEDHHVATPLLELFDGPLVDDAEVVGVGTVVVDELDQHGAFGLTFDGRQLCGHTALHHIGEGLVVLHEGAALKRRNALHGIVDGRGGESRIELHQGRTQHVGQIGHAHVVLYVVSALVLIAQFVAEQFYQRLLVGVFGEG